MQAEATAPETATGGLGDLAAAATASPVVTPEGGQKFATVEEAGAQSQAAARAFMQGDAEVWEDAGALQARTQKWESTTFLTELLKGKDGVTRAEEEAEKLEVGRTFLRACVGDRAQPMRRQARRRSRDRSCGFVRSTMETCEWTEG